MGQSYQFWSIKMKTLFKPQDPWDLIETGFAGLNEEQRLKENRKKDAKALFFLQQAIHGTIFPELQQPPLKGKLGEFFKQNFK